MQRRTDRSPASGVGGRAVARSASKRRTYRRRRAGVVLAAVVVAIGVVAAVRGDAGASASFPPPSEASLAGLGLRARIVAIAESQVGYRTDPTASYCNKYSASWHAGTSQCPGGEEAERWCADFAAWVWRLAGVQFAYGYLPGEINAGAASFYEWGVDHGTWHPAVPGFVAAPGDVAVYGLTLDPAPSAAHVAIVTEDRSGQRGPDVVNGDGDRTGFSVVERGHDQLRADAGHGDSALAGYVSPT